MSGPVPFRPMDVLMAETAALKDELKRAQRALQTVMATAQVNEMGSLAVICALLSRLGGTATITRAETATYSPEFIGKAFRQAINAADELILTLDEFAQPAEASAPPKPSDNIILLDRGH